MRFFRLRGRKRKPELEDLATLISAIDGFRVGRCAELRSVEKIVKKVRLTDTGRKWKSIRRDLEAIMDLPTSSSKVMFMMNLALLLRFLGVLSYTMVFILAIMMGLGLSPSFNVNASIFVTIFDYVLIFGIGVLVVRYFVKEQIKKFFDQSADKFKGKSAHLRELNQELLNRLSEGIKKSNGKSRDYKLTLFNADYNGIKILKKPGVWREHFTAITTE